MSNSKRNYQIVKLVVLSFYILTSIYENFSGPTPLSALGNVSLLILTNLGGVLWYLVCSSISLWF